MKTDASSMMSCDGREEAEFTFAAFYLYLLFLDTHSPRLLLLQLLLVSLSFAASFSLSFPILSLSCSRLLSFPPLFYFIFSFGPLILALKLSLSLFPNLPLLVSPPLATLTPFPVLSLPLSAVLLFLSSLSPSQLSRSHFLCFSLSNTPDFSFSFSTFLLTLGLSSLLSYSHSHLLPKTLPFYSLSQPRSLLSLSLLYLNTRLSPSHTLGSLSLSPLLFLSFSRSLSIKEAVPYSSLFLVFIAERHLTLVLLPLVPLFLMFATLFFHAA